MSGEGRVVCVTGASGYVASWLIKLLLERSYTVKATVRNLSDPTKVVHLKALEGAEERLHLFEADLLADGSFDSAVDGCEGVFHTASPVFYAAADPQKDIIEPAVKGTLNVLKSCSKTPSVRRMVLTSSIVSVLCNGNSKDPGVVVDETWFSDKLFLQEKETPKYIGPRRSPPSTCPGRRCGINFQFSFLWKINIYIYIYMQLWYQLAKTMAEETAWKFAQENGIDLVVMNPGLVLGPLLQPTLNLSSELFLDIVKGKEVYYREKEAFPTYEIVDVRDVGYAHILGFEKPSASGRYCLVGATLSHSETLRILHKLYPSIVPLSSEENPTYQVSKKKAECLGINFMPLEKTLKDTIENLKGSNFLSL